ncbi:MAG: uL15 family ribosomal protein [Nanoarchaeota archaeon]|nr:uL15 family ribosomal protein [Nanoarchaeota archaeon]
MKLVKRTKFSRMRATRYHGHAMKKHKGKGNQGGRGMAGTGKRADQKKSLIINKYGTKYFGKTGITSKGTLRKKNNVMNLEEIQKKYPNEKNQINLEGYKILGKGTLTSKLTIKAKSASKSAIEKIQKAGGKLILPEVKEKPKVEVKKEPENKKAE